MQPNPTAAPRARRRRFLLAVLVLLAAAVGGTAWYRMYRHRQTLEKCQRLTSLTNEGLAYLENLQPLSKADAIFTKVIAEFPDEPLGHRNLAIARLRRLTEPKPIPLASAQAAIDGLLRIEPDSPAAHLLASRLAKEAHDRVLAEAELRKAIELAPQDVALRYELFKLRSESPDAELRRRASEALLQSLELAHDNLFVLVNSARWQVEQHDPQAAKTLQTLLQLVEQMPILRESLQNKPGIGSQSMLDLLIAAHSASQDQDWPKSLAATRAFTNLFQPIPIVQSDRIRIEKDPLEYVLQRPLTLDCAHGNCHEDVPPIQVTLTQLPKDATLSKLPKLRDVALADFDLDGRLDLVLLADHEVIVLGRAAGAKTWQAITRLPVEGEYSKLVIGDLDQDVPKSTVAPIQTSRQPGEKNGAQQNGKQEGGTRARPRPPLGDIDNWLKVDVDLILHGAAGMLFLRNQLDEATKQRTLVPVAQDKALADRRNVRLCVLVDVYHDGDLDLAAVDDEGLTLWSNRGNMTFVRIAQSSTLTPDGLRIASIVPVDWDRDVDLDLLLCAENGIAAGYVENLRHAQFRWHEFDEPFASLKSASSLVVLETNGDGSWDLARASDHGCTLTTTQTSPAGTVQAVNTLQLSATPAAGMLAFDFDNDRRQDLLAWSKEELQVFEPDGESGFALRANLVDAKVKGAEQCVTGDLDEDGDLDVILLHNGQLTILDNRGGNQNHWLKIALAAGQVDQQSVGFRINHYGLGSTIEVRAGECYQAQILTTQTTHFGLGPRKQADVARILWTSGVPQNVVHPQGDTMVREEQTLKGSCPYLYTWTGTKFEFLTDCLWAAPLGLQFAEGQVAPWRAWEYLNIPGQRLVPRHSRYRLAITEELWEAAFFDQVQLICVDHPDNVNVYSNEKVGPAEIAAFKVHTVREPRTPLAARDGHGRDVLRQVRAQDGDYLRGFDYRLCQGLTETHSLELDLGELAPDARVTLFLTGWIYPTDTSLNIALSQNPDAPPLQPPSLWIPDATGEWRQALPYMGFPGGKTKTMAVDLAGLFKTADHRLRIVTNQEIYWDQAFFTVDEPPADVELTYLDPVVADLHARGYSRRVKDAGNGPEDFLYDDVATEPRWPPMDGHLTRFGDVADLLRSTDDELVVMGAGDELLLEFDVPHAPRPGWKRDFLLYNVGWDKDADLNTIYGQTIEPLPTGALGDPSRAPADPISDLDSNARYDAYLRKYQTRRQNWAHYWNHLRRSPLRSAP